MLQVNRRLRVPLVAATAAASLRAVIGLLIMAIDTITHEADMLMFFDIPTLGLYFLLARIGYAHDIANAYDVRFLVVASVLWFVLGGAIVLITVTRRGGV